VEYDQQGTPRKFALPATLTKTGTPRRVPISRRLAAVLEMRRHGPDGQALPTMAYVFGNECGEQVKSVRTAWRLTCQRAGIVGLHLHDLRREFGSRLLESGASTHQVRNFLGHANISQTNTYLAADDAHLDDALRKLENAFPIRTPLAQTPDPAMLAPSEAQPATGAKLLN